MSDRPLSGKVGLDTGDFKAGISELNRSVRIIESGFRATAAGLGDWSKTASGLEMRMGALTSKIEVQQKKVAALKGEYERIRAEKGENSREAQEMEIRLNKETEALGKSQAELKQSEESLKGMKEESKKAGDETKKLGDEEEKTTKKTDTLGKALDGLKDVAKIGIGVVAGLAGAVAGVAAGITGLVLKTTEAAGELVDLSLKTGINVEKLQELRYVGEQTGTDLETMTGSLARLTRSMTEVGDNKDITKAFTDLGVNVRDTQGNLRDSEEVFSDVIHALGGVQDETLRDAIAMQIFGKSAMELNPLIKAGSGEIARLRQEARDTGAVMSEDNVNAFESFGDTLAGMKAGLMGTLGTLAGAFLPGFKNLATVGGGYLQQFTGIVQGANGDLGQMATGIGGLLGQIVSDVAKKGPEMLQAGLGIIQGIINAVVTNIPLMLPGIITMITSLVQFILQNLPLLLNAGIQILLALVEGIGGMLPQMVAMGLQLIVTLANGLAEAIPQLLPMIATIIPEIVLVLIQNLPLIIDAALKLIIALVSGLITALPILIRYVPTIVQAIFDALIAALPLILTAAGEIILKLIEGIGNMLPQLGTAAGQVVQAIVDGVKGLWTTITTVGVDIVTGVWEGIKDQADWLLDQVKGFFTNLIDGAKDAIFAHSPSGLFAEEVGKPMALGIGEGFNEGMRMVARNMTNSMSGLTGAMQFGTPGFNGGFVQAVPQRAPITVQIDAYVANEIDIDRMAYRVVEIIQRAGQ